MTLKKIDVSNGQSEINVHICDDTQYEVYYRVNKGKLHFPELIGLPSVCTVTAVECDDDSFIHFITGLGIERCRRVSPNNTYSKQWKARIGKTNTARQSVSAKFLSERLGYINNEKLSVYLNATLCFYRISIRNETIRYECGMKLDYKNIIKVVSNDDGETYDPIAQII